MGAQMYFYLGMHSYVHTIFFKIVAFLMNDDNLILHNLHYITAHIALSLHFNAGITPYFSH